MARKPPEYQVFWQGDLVLEIRDEPGPLISRPAPPPPPGTEPVMHPFLTATAFVPEHEEKLRAALDEADTLEGYLSTLREMGYDVVEK